MNLSEPLRIAIVADSGITGQLTAYAGSYPVFTRRPAPSGAPYPMIMISPDVVVTENDGINDDRPSIVRDVAVYGSNENAANYVEVEAIAYALRDLFHRQRASITVSGWTVTDVLALGPRAVPADDEQRIGRAVELTVQLARLL